MVVLPLMVKWRAKQGQEEESEWNGVRWLSTALPDPEIQVQEQVSDDLNSDELSDSVWKQRCENSHGKHFQHWVLLDLPTRT